MAGERPRLPVQESPRHRRKRPKRKAWALQIKNGRDSRLRNTGFRNWTTIRRYETREQLEQALKGGALVPWRGSTLWTRRGIGPEGEVVQEAEGE